MGINDLREWLRRAPPGASIEADALLRMLEEIEPVEPLPEPPPEPPVELTWRERLWLVPAETRLGTREVLEALDRSRSWLYGHLEAGGIPYRKLDGELVFTAGELRAWLRSHEEVVSAGPMESTEAERSGRAERGADRPRGGQGPDLAALRGPGS